MSGPGEGADSRHFTPTFILPLEGGGVLAVRYQRFTVTRPAADEALCGSYPG